MSGHVLTTPSPAHHDTFRNRLRSELAARCGRNPRYSLRAFANFLDIDHASLSQMMRGARACTAQTIRRLGARIGLTAEEIARYIAAAELKLDHAQPATDNRKLADDAAVILGSWSAFAILELMQLKEFRPDVRWIARMLGIESDEVQIMLQHLIRLDFLQMKEAGKWIDLTGGAIYREDQFTLMVLERIARRSLEAQLASARNAPEAPRLHGALTLAVDEHELRALIAAAERMLTGAQNSTTPQSPARTRRLYHFEVNCYPLSTESTEPTDPASNAESNPTLKGK